ncbi:MAG: CHC2 zinc finger domain-containing protein [Huintestinicola sp.]
MNIFEEVKAAVDINTAAEYYGLNVRKNTVLCPFHNEKTGSLKLYHDHFYCFGCGEHGDVIKLTGKLLGLSPIESARRLATDFNVIIHDDFNPREQTRNKASPQRMVAYRERENRAYRLLVDYCKYLEDCRIRYAPHSPDERPHPLFVTALCELEMFKYYRDIFIYGDYNERKAFIEEQGKLLEAISSVLVNKAA